MSKTRWSRHVIALDNCSAELVGAVIACGLMKGKRPFVLGRVEAQLSMTEPALDEALDVGDLLLWTYIRLVLDSASSLQRWSLY